MNCYNLDSELLIYFFISLFFVYLFFLCVLMFRFFSFHLQIDPKVAFPRRAHPKVSFYLYIYLYITKKKKKKKKPPVICVLPEIFNNVESYFIFSLHSLYIFFELLFYFALFFPQTYLGIKIGRLFWPFSFPKFSVIIYLFLFSPHFTSPHLTSPHLTCLHIFSSTQTYLHLPVLNGVADYLGLTCVYLCV